jgi:hypothetical protein
VCSLDALAGIWAGFFAYLVPNEQNGLGPEHVLVAHVTPFGSQGKPLQKLLSSGLSLVWGCLGRARQLAIIVLFGTAPLLPMRALASGIAAPGSTALGSASAAVNLMAVLPPTLGLNISALNLEIEVIDPGQRSAVITAPVTSSWSLSSSSSAVELVGYFESAQHALADARNNTIPSSRVLGGINAEAMLPFAETASVGTAGASRTLFRQLISRQNVRGNRTDNLKIQVDRVDDLGIVPGEYTGVLHLRVISY